MLFLLILKGVIMKFNQVNQIKKSQRGVSIFDFILWFAIIGAFLGAMYAIYMPSRSQTKAQAVYLEIQTLQSTVHTIYENKADRYKDVTMGTLFTLGVLPTSFRKNGDDYVSNEGGPVKITDASPNGFTIEYSSIPTGTCSLVAGKLNPQEWNGDPTCTVNTDSKTSRLVAKSF